MRVVGEAADGHAALDVVAATRCDVVLMDVRMPRLDGVAATRRLLTRDPEGPKVVVLTTFDLDEHAFAALRAGASGFLLKDAPAEEVLAEIAARLHLAEPTVKTYVGRILAKLGLRDRVHIVIRAYETGLVRRGRR